MFDFTVMLLHLPPPH